MPRGPEHPADRTAFMLADSAPVLLLKQSELNVARCCATCNDREWVKVIDD